MTMSDNYFYDDETIYTVFREEMREQKMNALRAENLKYKDIIQQALPIVMEHFSEEVYSAGWMYDLDIFSPREDELIGKMAEAIGEIPYWNEGDLDWRKYPGERDFNDES